MTGEQYIKNVLIGGVFGAVTNGITAALNGRNFWTGELTRDGFVSSVPSRGPAEIPAANSEIPEPIPAVEEPSGIDMNLPEQQMPMVRVEGNDNIRFNSSQTDNLEETLNRIENGGSFPHRNDGSIFRNRENLLPTQPKGYYREFVHPTPGVIGPGAQRIVTGSQGEIWYTPDHYRTFFRIR